MSSDHNDTRDDGDGTDDTDESVDRFDTDHRERRARADEPTKVDSLEQRVRDLEVEVYGHRGDGDGGGGEVSAGQSAVVDMKRTAVFLDERTDGDGAQIDDILAVAERIGLDRTTAEQAYQKLRRRGEVYEPADGLVRPT